MGLETGNYPSDLVSSNPLGTDDKSQGDDHIRLIKNVIKTTFPNIDGAVTSTQDELNDIADTTMFFQSGMIIMWSGTLANIPTGFNICDGTNGTPNLVGRFIVGSATDVGGSYDIGDVGGTDSNTHAHSGSIAGHTLTESQIPSHRHTSGVARSEGFYGVTSPGGSVNRATGTTAETKSPLTSYTGGGGSHNHGLTVDNTTLDNRPPYFALAYIMKS